ncbi:DUF6770 family protein [Chitinophaga sancti]|uniref:DUF6770 family protein n=2 Tax=Chitinophaga sancti TaxID=1004 RepID=A0A1K1SXA1_9BACT|nr:DUF6770 family protein [Chitinophaga sancti]WQD62284.1 DUF6770 family protein [Chitinophaga sancti]WQG92147.1 DUF6770 family protein [Chitinophaga sancti]SFW88985.1 hypothetical protein SAMN05661012_06351 [Chitinophaga sancti]
MIRRLLTLALFVGASATNVKAQSKLTVDKVYSAYLQNSGTIIQQGQIKGYFYLIQSDKIDRHTNEYTLQIVDENLNKVQDIKFEDTKKLSLLESAYNGNSLAFLFKNEEEKLLQMKVYDLEGKLKFTYSRPYTKKTDALMTQYETLHTDEGMNQTVFNLGDKGFISVLPLRDGREVTYEVDMYSSEKKKQWTYIPDGDDQKYANAEYLGATDSLVILEVIRKNRRMSGSGTAHLVGINPMTKKKVFDIDDEKDKWTFVPSSVLPVAGSGKFIAMGNYYDKDANIAKDASKGLAIYEIDNNGNILNKTYNSWAVDIAKHLPTNTKGKIDNIGYLYIHKMIPGANGKIFIVGEGYKKQASAGGIALTALNAAAGSYRNAGVTKVVVTDLVVMEFDGAYKMKDAKIYDKTNNTVVGGPMSDYVSQHALAMYIKMIGAFDYEFTTGNPDDNNFAICFSDWERSSSYKGQTFNSIRYNGTKFTQDKIELKSKASRMRVLPAKSGSVMIIEYFKKDKKLECRLEKLG